jgi:hypothetical protein
MLDDIRKDIAIRKNSSFFIVLVWIMNGFQFNVANLVNMIVMANSVGGKEKYHFTYYKNSITTNSFFIGTSYFCI